MNDLVQFLRARLDEHEQAARAANVKQGDPRWTVTDGDAVAGHIARWDPARVLADVEAKRRIVDRYADAERAASEVRDIGWTPRLEDRGKVELAGYNATAIALRGAAECLALPHSDHPDYREEWRP